MADTETRRRVDDAPPETSKTINPRGELFGQSVTIARPQHEVFAFFRDFANLPRFMDTIERVDVIDDRRSHWVAKAPGGKTVEWDSLLTEEIEGESLTWHSENADIENSGRISFVDAGARGTVVRAVLHYDPPGGTIGKLIAKMFQREPHIAARRDLRRLKQLLETGEIATNVRNPAQLAEEGK